MCLLHHVLYTLLASYKLYSNVIIECKMYSYATVTLYVAIVLIHKSLYSYRILN